METAARPTRFAELSYRQQARALWRFVDNETGAAVGPHYRTKDELFADLERYACLFGCAGSTSNGEAESQPKESTEPRFPAPVNPLGPRGKPVRLLRSRPRGNPRTWGQR